jgi:hypothetical protein
MRDFFRELWREPVTNGDLLAYALGFIVANALIEAVTR